MSEQKEVKNQEIKEYGQMELADNRQQHKLHLLSIIGEVEGHECLSANTKTTKYEHVLPKLAQVEDDREIDGLLVLAVAADFSFIVPTGTMVIHPVRMSGTVIGAPQTYDYFQQMQDRITGFIASHSQTNRERMEELMLNTGMLTKDLGTILVGHQAVEEGIINEVGGISDAVQRLHFMINESSI